MSCRPFCLKMAIIGPCRQRSYTAKFPRQTFSCARVVPDRLGAVAGSHNDAQHSFGPRLLACPASHEPVRGPRVVAGPLGPPKDPIRIAPGHMQLEPVDRAWDLELANVRNGHDARRVGWRGAALVGCRCLWLKRVLHTQGVVVVLLDAEHANTTKKSDHEPEDKGQK